MDRFPCLFPDRLDVLLEDRLRGILPHLQAGEAPEGIGILQVEGQFFVGEFPVLLEDGAAKHLLGSHALPAGIGTMCPREVLKDEVHYGWGGIEDLGDLFELLHNGVSHDRGEEVHLGVEFVAHSGAPHKEMSE